jgi:hypothetical protein
MRARLWFVGVESLRLERDGGDQAGKKMKNDGAEGRAQ